MCAEHQRALAVRFGIRPEHQLFFLGTDFIVVAYYGGLATGYGAIVSPNCNGVFTGHIIGTPEGHRAFTRYERTVANGNAVVTSCSSLVTNSDGVFHQALSMTTEGKTIATCCSSIVATCETVFSCNCVISTKGKCVIRINVILESGYH